MEVRRLRVFLLYIIILTRLASRLSPAALHAPLPNVKLACTNTASPNSAFGTLVLSVPLVSATGHRTRMLSDPLVKQLSGTVNQRVGECEGRVPQKQATWKTRKITGWTKTNLSRLSRLNLNDAESRRKRLYQWTTAMKKRKKKLHGDLDDVAERQRWFIQNTHPKIHYSTLYSPCLIQNPIPKAMSRTLRQCTVVCYCSIDDFA